MKPTIPKRKTRTQKASPKEPAKCGLRRFVSLILDEDAVLASVGLSAKDWRLVRVYRGEDGEISSIGIVDADEVKEATIEELN